MNFTNTHRAKMFDFLSLNKEYIFGSSYSNMNWCYYIDKLICTFLKHSKEKLKTAFVNILHIVCFQANSFQFFLDSNLFHYPAKSKNVMCL